MSERKRKSMADILELHVSNPQPTKEKTTLSKILEEEKERLVAELDHLRLKKQVEDVKKELGAESTSGTAVTSTKQISMGGPNAAASLLSSLVAQGMTPEEIDKYVRSLSPQTIAAFNALSSNNPMMGLMLIAGMRQQDKTPEQITVKDVVEIANTLKPQQQDQTKLIELILSQKQQPQSQTSISEVMTLFKELVQPLSTELRNAETNTIKEKLERLENRPSVVDEFISKTDEVNAIRKMFGMEAGGVASDKDYEYKKLMLDHERWKAEKEFEFREKEIERGTSQDRLDTVLKSIILPFVERAGPLLDNLVPKTAGAGAAVAAGQAVRVGGNVFPCEKCGTAIPLPKVLPPYISCPSCGSVYGDKTRSQRDSPPRVDATPSPKQTDDDISEFVRKKMEAGSNGKSEGDRSSSGEGNTGKGRVTDYTPDSKANK